MPSAAEKALEWYYDLDPEELDEVDAWLVGRAPPEGMSEIQYAYDNRDEILGEEGT